MIELQDIRAGYRGQEILHGIRLTMQNGRFTAVIGENGSGKSTLFKTIAGLIPHTGTILVDGESGLPRRELAKRLAYMPQNRNVPALTAERMTLHGRFPYLGYPRRYSEADRAAALAALARFGMENSAHVPMEELSGGERQKVYLAMAFAQQAENILLDEPLSHLDVRAQLSLMDALRSLAAEGRAVAAVLHDLGFALRFADDVAVLCRGRLIAFGSAADVLASRAVETAFGVRVQRADCAEGSAYFFQK